MATHTSTPASVAAALVRLGSADAVAAALEAADVPPEILTAIEVVSIAAAESANKRRLMAIDVRNDALGRVGTIQTLIELLGRRAGSLVCRRWRDSSLALALTKFEEERLVLRPSFGQDLLLRSRRLFFAHLFLLRRAMLLQETRLFLRLG